MRRRPSIGTVVILATLPPGVVLLGFVVPRMYRLMTSATHTGSDQLLRYVCAWLLALAFSLAMIFVVMEVFAAVFAQAFPAAIYTMSDRDHFAVLCSMFFVSVLAVANITVHAGFAIESTIGALYRTTF